MSIPIPESIHTFNRNEIQEKAFRFNLSLSIHPESPVAYWHVHIVIELLQGRESTRGSSRSSGDALVCLIAIELEESSGE